MDRIDTKDRKSAFQALPRLRAVTAYDRTGGRRSLDIVLYGAFRTLQRLRGLLGRPPLKTHEALLLRPCNQIHTFGMRYALDLVFLDREGLIVKCVAGLPPRRMAVSRRAIQVIEMPAGSLQRTGLCPGEKLSWTE